MTRPIAADVAIAPDDLLALIEDGPKSAEIVAAWLHVPRIAVVHAFQQLRRDGLVKRTGTAKDWCLASYQAVNGRRKGVQFDVTATRRAILARVTQGPSAPTSLHDASGVGRRATNQVLRQLEAEGTIKALSNGRYLRWALASYEPPSPPIPDITVSDNPQRPVRRQASDPSEGRSLRQPAKMVEVLTWDTPPSWWVGLSRDQLNAGAKLHHERMRSSREAMRLHRGTAHE